MNDAREELDAGRSGGCVGRREGREREAVYREGFYLANRHLPNVKVFIIIFSIVICQRWPTPGLPLDDT